MNDSMNKQAAPAGVGHGRRGTKQRQIPVRLGRWALAAAVVASTMGSAPARATTSPDVAPAAENRLWGGCQLTSNTASALVTETGGPADFIVVYSLQKNDGQPFQNNVRFTGPIVCTGPTTKIKSYTEGTPLPN
jgi:hypothetical protein